MIQRVKTIDHKIRLLSKCAICENTLKQGTPAEVIFEDDLRSLIHLKCTVCGSRLLGFLEGDEFLGTRSDIFITDLEAEEARKFLRQKKVGVDHLIDLYEILEKGQYQKLINF